MKTIALLPFLILLTLGVGPAYPQTHEPSASRSAEPAATTVPSLRDPVLLTEEEGSYFLELRDRRLTSELATLEDLMLDTQWDRWHEDVADAICEQLNRKVWPRKLLVFRTTFVATSEGQITAVNIDTNSRNEHFKAFVEQSIRALAGKTDLLRFPSKSVRKMFLVGTTFSAANGAFNHDAKRLYYGAWPDAMLLPYEQ